MIHTPNLLHSLIQLNRYNINNHINEEKDREALIIRDRSRLCLGNIQKYGDESTQFELVSSEYAGVQVLQVSTAGGDGEQDDGQIFDGLYNISEFLKSLYQGRQTNYPNSGPKFPQQISLARRLNEQIEEEGGNEEVESQLINKWNNENINDQANRAKAEILNFYIDWSNPRPFWYEEDLHQ
ncbi:MAG: hypothetical protein EZS28_037683 [Streblomastix strix]|uniref:Uncharacterized protein n=1 Tax=Streblomastix strix TaxID=222440 RepID=A0A5J4U9B3_9EUKA|nr:MAG: hypothetical protein EZS28_037683 [Streblomastix strix]